MEEEKFLMMNLGYGVEKKTKNGNSKDDCLNEEKVSVHKARSVTFLQSQKVSSIETPI